MDRAPYRVQVLDRSCAILDYLAKHGPEAAVSEISADLGLSKTTVHRLLSALAQQDFVRRVLGTGRYSLGAKLVELGRKAGDSGGPAAIAEPHLRQLVTETGETAHLGVLSGGEVISLCAVESPKTLRTPATVGRRTPAHASSLGKCLLADLSKSELVTAMALLSFDRFTPRTIVTQQLFLSELAKVRRQGYAVDAEELERGLKCVGAPVRDRSRRVTFALSIAGPVDRLGPEVINQRIASVVRMAAELSEALGYRPNNVRERAVRSA
jgi:DNA-binding IclR family transcriptional regulator